MDWAHSTSYCQHTSNSKKCGSTRSIFVLIGGRSFEVMEVARMLNKWKNAQEIMSQCELKVKVLTKGYTTQEDVLEAKWTALVERIRSLKEEKKNISALWEQVTSIKDAPKAQRALLEERIVSLEEENNSWWRYKTFNEEQEIQHDLKTKGEETEGGITGCSHNKRKKPWCDWPAGHPWLWNIRNKLLQAVLYQLHQQKTSV